MAAREQAARVTAPAARRRGPASTEDGQRSRDRILQAALDLIIEAGIDQVRLAEIARRAGMSSGQVMYYFASKEHILLETLAWQEHKDTMRRRAALARVTGAWRQLERLIELYLPAGHPDPSWILWLEAWARAPHNKDVNQFLEELLNPWLDDLTAIITRGVEEGVFNPPAAMGDFTLRFIALLDGLGLQRLQQMRHSSRKYLTELAMHAARAELDPGFRTSRPAGERELAVGQRRSLFAGARAEPNSMPAGEPAATFGGYRPY
jgi:AcrR family transcriptional regulator